MHDELTKQDIRKMKEELEHRRNELLPEQLEEVKRTRAFGDLSENWFITHLWGVKVNK
jgi:transcription elongation factor GreA